MQLLEDLSRPYRGIQSHPIHVLHSELYILELLAESCSTHWAGVNTISKPIHGDGQDSDFEGDDLEKGPKHFTLPKWNGQKRRESRNALLTRDKPPEPLTDDLIKRVLDAARLFLKPISENYVIPAANILDDAFRSMENKGLSSQENVSATNSNLNGTEVPKTLLNNAEAIDAHIREIIEYVSFSNWSRVLEYLRNALMYAAHASGGSAVQAGSGVEEDRNALVTIGFISSLWVDSRKLGIIIQELCGSFLHLRKAFQSVVAIVVPLLITRWVERSPAEFRELHTLHKRLDGGMYMVSLVTLLPFTLDI